MFTVYVLYSSTYNKIYIGYTSNLIQRFKSHNELSSKGWSIKFRPWIVLYTEIFDNKTLALKREKELKTAHGRSFIWGLVEQSIAADKLGSYPLKADGGSIPSFATG